MKLRLETLHDPALAAEDPEDLRRRVLALNRRLSDAPAFRANWDARIGSFLESTDVLDLAWRGEELVGHLGEWRLTLQGRPAVYIDTFTVAPELQSHGLGRRLAGRSVLRTIRHGRGREVLHLSRTSNPHVAAGVWNSLQDGRFYYPSFDPESPSRGELVEAAAELAAAHWPDRPFRRESGVLEGAYEGHFIEVPPTKYALVARHFERHVDPSRGDAIVQVVRYSPAAWLRLLFYFGWNRLFPPHKR